MRFKRFWGSLCCRTTNIYHFSIVKRDTLERKSILHFDSTASELSQHLSYHNLYLILDSHFTGRSPLSVIIGREIWAYRGNRMSQCREPNPQNKNNPAINCTIHSDCNKMFLFPSQELPRCYVPCFLSQREIFKTLHWSCRSEQLCIQYAVMWGSLINHLPGISWTGISRLIKMNPKMKSERS